MIKINNVEEFSQIIKSEEKKVIYWHAKWCPDCFRVSSYISKLEAEFIELEFYSFDRNISVPLARHLNIFGVPSFLIYQNGNEINRFVNKNRKTYQEVKDFIKANINL